MFLWSMCYRDSMLRPKGILVTATHSCVGKVMLSFCLSVHRGGGGYPLPWTKGNPLPDQGKTVLFKIGWYYQLSTEFWCCIKVTLPEGVSWYHLSCLHYSRGLGNFDTIPNNEFLFYLVYITWQRNYIWFKFYYGNNKSNNFPWIKSEICNKQVVNI